MCKTLIMMSVFACLSGHAPVMAQSLVPNIRVSEDTQQFAVTPSQAALIAKDANPGSKVLNVHLLPSGVYAVTLKQGGSVLKVMVDANSGSIG